MVGAMNSKTTASIRGRKTAAPVTVTIELDSPVTRRAAARARALMPDAPPNVSMGGYMERLILRDWEKNAAPEGIAIPESYRQVIVDAGKADRPKPLGYAAMLRHIVCSFVESVSVTDKAGNLRFQG